MEELIKKLTRFMQGEVIEIKNNGAAEIDIVLPADADGAQIARKLQEHIASMVDGNSIAKFNVQYPDGETIHEFSLNQ